MFFCSSGSMRSPLRAKMAALQARAMHLLTKRQYSAASDDALAALAVLEAAYPDESALAGEEALEAAAVLR